MMNATDQYLVNSYQNNLQVQKHVHPLAEFLKELLNDDAPNLEGEFVYMNNLPEFAFPYQPNNTDHAQAVNNFQVLREYNDCIKECINADLSVDTFIYDLDGYAIYINDNDFWENYEDYSTLEILCALAPGYDFDMHSCYIRENTRGKFETFGDASAFAYTVANEADKTLKSIIKCVKRLDREERTKLPRAVHFLNTLEQQAGQTEQWIY